MSYYPSKETSFSRLAEKALQDRSLYNSDSSSRNPHPEDQEFMENFLREVRDEQSKSSRFNVPGFSVAEQSIDPQYNLQTHTEDVLRDREKRALNDSLELGRIEERIKKSPHKQVFEEVWENSKLSPIKRDYENYWSEMESQHPPDTEIRLYDNAYNYKYLTDQYHYNHESIAFLRSISKRDMGNLKKEATLLIENNLITKDFAKALETINKYYINILKSENNINKNLNFLPFINDREEAEFYVGITRIMLDKFYNNEYYSALLYSLDIAGPTPYDDINGSKFWNSITNKDYNYAGQLLDISPNIRFQLSKEDSDNICKYYDDISKVLKKRMVPTFSNNPYLPKPESQSESEKLSYLFARISDTKTTKINVNAGFYDLEKEYQRFPLTEEMREQLEYDINILTDSLESDYIYGGMNDSVDRIGTNENYPEEINNFYKALLYKDLTRAKRYAENIIKNKIHNQQFFREISTLYNLYHIPKYGETTVIEVDSPIVPFTDYYDVKEYLSILSDLIHNYDKEYKINSKNLGLTWRPDIKDPTQVFEFWDALANKKYDRLLPTLDNLRETNIKFNPHNLREVIEYYENIANTNIERYPGNIFLPQPQSEEELMLILNALYNILYESEDYRNELQSDDFLSYKDWLKLVDEQNNLIITTLHKERDEKISKLLHSSANDRIPDVEVEYLKKLKKILYDINNKLITGDTYNRYLDYFFQNNPLTESENIIIQQGMKNINSIHWGTADQKVINQARLHDYYGLLAVGDSMFPRPVPLQAELVAKLAQIYNERQEEKNIIEENAMRHILKDFNKRSGDNEQTAQNPKNINTEKQPSIVTGSRNSKLRNPNIVRLTKLHEQQLKDLQTEFENERTYLDISLKSEKDKLENKFIQAEQQLKYNQQNEKFPLNSSQKRDLHLLTELKVERINKNKELKQRGIEQITKLNRYYTNQIKELKEKQKEELLNELAKISML